ncbi:copper resistance protein NlpE [Sphingobacterium sp. SRCM116780]|uniref:copper resistance protein NlpE n=1 Tax=Sphingobacterium sp. SRCM116780 TaxID=2907623 RepID=UPI001F32DA52|nr:copper resistance protein NlpE [Sphingobacterium sp. SRCM116780]UIR56518.1 copper resistance protein NlpE [Sphingobacterium sp. SRCM116780]
MKRLFILLLSILFVFTACDNQRKGAELIKDKEHRNADLNNLSGDYMGVMPCADCDGIETVLKLNKNFSYSYSSKYLNKSDEVFVKDGKWKFENNIITLEGVDYKFKLGDTKLLQLDLAGNEIGGELADNYKLEKMKE